MKKTRMIAIAMLTLMLVSILAVAAQGASAYHEKELSVIELVNAERKANGLSALELDSGLMFVADARAEEILINYSHTRPNGTDFYTIFNEEKTWIDYEFCGENLGRGTVCSAKEIVQAWMNSPAHRSNILNGEFTRIGVAYVEQGNIGYWVQLFAL